MRLIPRRVVYACAQYQSLRLERIGRNSSQMEVLQSPWIPETCFRHLLIFSSAKYNYTQSCLLAGTLVTAFFVRGLFLKKSHISPPLIWLRVPMVKFVCVCIFEIVYFLSF